MTSDASSGQANSFKDQLKADFTASSPGNVKQPQTEEEEQNLPLKELM